MPFDATNFEAPVEVDEVGQIILKARELISDPKRWTTGKLSSEGSYCLLGALGCKSLVFGDFPPLQAEAVRRLAIHITRTPNRARFDPASHVWLFNDESSHADVLALLDRAAKVKGENQ